jgi:uncharacterized membrane protein
METVEKSIIINAPVEKVFEYIDDPMNDPEWMIGMMEVHEGDGTKLTMKVEYTIPIPVLGKLAEHLISKQNERNLESSMENIKHMLEA